MKARIQITIETEVGQYGQEIACWDRKEHRSEDIGLTLAESKSLLAAIQKILRPSCARTHKAEPYATEFGYSLLSSLRSGSTLFA